MMANKNKPEVTFIYSSTNNKFFHDRLKYDDNLYYFFFEGLAKSSRIDFTAIDVKSVPFDCKLIKQPDILVIDSFAKPLLRNLDSLDCPKFLRAPDPYDFDQTFQDFCLVNNIEHLFYSPCESSFRRIVDTPLHYHQIIHGIREPEQAQRAFKDRSAKILFTGCIGNFFDRFYHLRRVIAESKLADSIDFLKPYQLDNCGGRYRSCLTGHKASIAATRQYFSLKYLEIPAAGTLCFMENDNLNGIRELGFIDGINAIFITEDDWIIKFVKFMTKPYSVEYSEIAKAGHDLVMSKYENSIQVNKLIDIFIDQIE